MRLITFIVFFISLHSYSQDYWVKSIVIDGNKKTKEFIVLRELPFQQGDTIPEKKLEALIDLGERNLVNTELFTNINITTIPGFDKELIVLIELKEMWYIFPTPIFQLADPNFNIWWQSKDFSRTNYGLSYLQKNFRGRNERLSLKFQFGYSESFRLNYIIPGINKKRTIGLLIDAAYTQFGEVTTATENNIRVFFDDNSGKSKEQKRFGIGLINRPQFNLKQRLFVGIDSYTIVDSLQMTFQDHLNNASNRTSFLEVNYKLNYDNVDFIAYPQEGFNFSFESQLKGIGKAKQNMIANLFLELGMHSRLSERWVVQNGIQLKKSFYDRFPYTLQRGLGYDDVQVRGYGLYLIDGQAYSLFRNNLKYNLVKPFELYLGKKKRDIFTFPLAFYVNLFVDFAYVSDKLYAEQNFLDNKWIGGTGIGLDVVGKYNRVFRIEFAMNDIKEQGVFLQFKRSI